MTALSTLVSQPLPAAPSGRLLGLLSPLPAFEVFLPDSSGRYRATQYIADQFKAIHGACVHDFMPLLVSMSCQGHFSAVGGIRPATHHQLFLEQYLEKPVESVLGEMVSREVHRNRIVEVGNLVATQIGASQLLFLVLTALLHRSGFEWVVFTGTPVVIRGLERLGFRLETLCPADPAKLTHSNPSDWGRYYEQQPQVVTGNVPEAIRVLSGHRLHSVALTLFEQQISQLAPTFCTPGLPYGTHAVSA